MNAIDKTKTFVIKYKYYFIGGIAIFIILKLFLNSRNSSGDSSGEYMVTQNPQTTTTAADNSVAIMQMQQQFQLAQQKLAFDHEDELADKQLTSKAQDNLLQQQINQGNIDLEKSRIANDRYVAEQNAFISQQNQAAADRNTKLTLDYQQQIAQLQIASQDRTNQLNASLKGQELDVQKYVANRNIEYQTFLTDKQAKIAKKESNNVLWGGIANGLFTLAGNYMTGGAFGTAKSIGNTKTYSF